MGRDVIRESVFPDNAMSVDWNNFLAVVKLGVVKRRVSTAARWIRNPRAASRLSEAFLRIPEGTAALGQISERLEKQFLAIGDALDRQASATRRLKADSDALVTLAAGANEKGHPIRDAVNLARDVFTFIESATADVHTMSGRLAGFCSQIRNLESSDALLRRILAPLGTIEVLFRIESARLPLELQTVFASLTAEIRSLQSEVETVFSQQASALEETHKCVADAAVSLGAHARAQSQAIDAERENIHAAVASLETELRARSERDVRTAELSESAARETSEIVVMLQFQDITKQKIQHILAAAEELTAMPVAILARGDQHALTQALEIALVQEAQVGALAEDLDRASGRLTSGIDRLQTSLNKVEVECLGLAQVERVTSAVDSLVQALLHALKRVRDILSAADEATVHAFQAVERLNSTAKVATSTMRKLAIDIRFLALNAQVQAAQVGALNGLEVLSSQTCAIADETNTFSASSGSNLQVLVDELNAVVQDCHELRAKTDEGRNALDVRGAEAEGRLKDYHREALSHVESVSVLLKEASGISAEMHQLNRLGDLSEKSAADVGGVFKQVAETLRTLLRNPHFTPTPETISARYTMESERRVHAQALSLPATASAVIPAAPESSANSDDNIELF